MHKTHRVRRFAGIAAVVGAIAFAGSAYTNANTFAAEPKAGAGSQAVSGYDISDVHYNLSAADPQNIDSLDFTLDAVPALTATIKYRLSDTGAWSGDCVHVGTLVAACPAPAGSTVAGVTNLTVVVAD